MAAVQQVHRGPTDLQLEDHILLHLRLEIAPKFGLRVEPKHKTIGPEAFTYFAYFRAVRDRTTFTLGLDCLDDMFGCILLMWTGRRKHELDMPRIGITRRSSCGTTRNPVRTLFSITRRTNTSSSAPRSAGCVRGG